MATPAELVLADPQTAADLRTFVTRARAAEDGAVRLQAGGKVLAAYVCVMRPRLLGEAMPTILGLRTMPLAEPAEVDVTVPLASVADRLARMGVDDAVLPLPPVGANETWAGVSPPRGGWSRTGGLGTDELIAAAKAGVRDVADTVPANPGALIVNNVRATVWGRPLPDAPQVPAGAAFAGYALGFWAPGGTASVYEEARWVRISTAQGHVLVRPAASF